MLTATLCKNKRKREPALKNSQFSFPPITPTFTADVLPTFTEGRKRKYIISPPFTDDELSTFTEDSKKITNIDVHCRWSTNVH